VYLLLRVCVYVCVIYVQQLFINYSLFEVNLLITVYLNKK